MDSLKRMIRAGSAGANRIVRGRAVRDATPMDEHTALAGDGQSPSVLAHARRRLGRGLNALLGGGGIPGAEHCDSEDADGHDSLPPDHIPVGAIDRNPFQPRKEFAEEAIAELGASIKLHGLLQPLLVRPAGGRFQLIAGERRWIAAKRAGLATVPCRVLQLEDRQVYEVAIEENLKRKDLGVMEKAAAFKDYLDRFACSIEELAGRLSMNRATLSNYLRLLDLPDEVKTAVNAEKISNGHARALLSLQESDQIALCRRVIADSLSVRKTEEAVRGIQKARAAAESADVVPFPSGESHAPAAAEHHGPSDHVRSLQEQLRQLLGAKVDIQVKGKDAGKIVIPFASTGEFEELIRRLRRAA
jgi:ParB family transcriptional regulator, chromosome partitioning protein